MAIGGGGLAASVACWLKKFWPDIKVVGGGVDQASMKTHGTGHRVNLDYVDVFCDGTAVHIPGEYTYPLCRDLIDEFVTVTNNEVCQAIRGHVGIFPSACSGTVRSHEPGRVRETMERGTGQAGRKELLSSFPEPTWISPSSPRSPARRESATMSARYVRISMASKRARCLKYLRHAPGHHAGGRSTARFGGDTQYPVFGIAASLTKI